MLSWIHGQFSFTYSQWSFVFWPCILLKNPSKNSSVISLIVSDHSEFPQLKGQRAAGIYSTSHVQGAISDLIPGSVIYKQEGRITAGTFFSSTTPAWHNPHQTAAKGADQTNSLPFHECTTHSSFFSKPAPGSALKGLSFHDSSRRLYGYPCTQPQGQASTPKSGSLSPGRPSQQEQVLR